MNYMIYEFGRKTGMWSPVLFLLSFILGAKMTPAKALCSAISCWEMYRGVFYMERHVGIPLGLMRLLAFGVWYWEIHCWLISKLRSLIWALSMIKIIFWIRVATVVILSTTTYPSRHIVNSLPSSSLKNRWSYAKHIALCLEEYLFSVHGEYPYFSLWKHRIPLCGRIIINFISPY